MQVAQLAMQVMLAGQNTWPCGQPPHTPLLHCWPFAHALQAAPLVPHDCAVLPAMHWLFEQHPLGHEAPLH